MGIAPAPFWANLYISKHECHFISKLIKKALLEIKRFMELSDLLEIFVQLMMEWDFKSHTNNFTSMNWS